MDIISEIGASENCKDILLDIINNLYGSKQAASRHLDVHRYESAKESFKTIITEGDYDETKIAETLIATSWPQDHIELFKKLFEEHKTNILCASLNNHNSFYGQAIEDFDWMVKLILGTSELKTLKSPVLELILSILDHSGRQKKILYDMNKDMLLKFIIAIENILQ